MMWISRFGESVRMLVIGTCTKIMNDIQLGVSGADLWHVVLLLHMVLNFPFGPWEGGWYKKIQDMAQDIFQSIFWSQPRL